MPGVGKSTLGLLLAKKLGMDFVDTDILIQVNWGKTLQQIINNSDYLTLRDYEQQVLLNLNCTNKVVATGGSAVNGNRLSHQVARIISRLIKIGRAHV